MTEESKDRALTRDEVGQMLAERAIAEGEQHAARMAPYDDELDQSVSLAFQLVRTARAFEHHLTLAARDLTMTALQARFAWLLASAPFGIPMTTLWVELGMSQPGALQMVRRMQASGLVEIDVSSWDTRNSVVSLTDLGLQQWAAVRGRVREVCDELIESLGQRGLAPFRSDLTRVEAVDERYPRFRSLRDPLSFLS